MKTKFTQGPWKIHNTISFDGKLNQTPIGPEDYHLAKVIHYGDNCFANAHLISAAPEMYEALQEVRMYLSTLLQENGCLVSENKTYQKIDLAIKKARGKL